MGVVRAGSAQEAWRRERRWRGCYLWLVAETGRGQRFKAFLGDVLGSCRIAQYPPACGVDETSVPCAPCTKGFPVALPRPILQQVFVFPCPDAPFPFLSLEYCGRSCNYRCRLGRRKRNQGAGLEKPVGTERSRKGPVTPDSGAARRAFYFSSGSICLNRGVPAARSHSKMAICAVRSGTPACAMRSRPALYSFLSVDTTASRATKGS